MIESKRISSPEELIRLLTEKRNLYNQMLSEDKEFEQVKSLFIEIKELEKSLKESQYAPD
jgi:hypothetical protein